jgi:hypothetical protein
LEVADREQACDNSERQPDGNYSTEPVGACRPISGMLERKPALIAQSSRQFWFANGRANAGSEIRFIHC